MTLFICAAGTSVMGPSSDPAKLMTPSERIDAKVAREQTMAAGNRESFLVRVSAETHGLYRARVSNGDRVVFLTSDTDEGRAASERLVSLTEAAFGCYARLQVIQGLQVNDGKRFQREGIDALFNALDSLTWDQPAKGVRINATGGFKGTLPYIVLYAMIEGIDVDYVYEWSNALIRLPPLPVHFDWARLAGVGPAILSIFHDGPIAEAAWRDLLPTDYYARQDEYDALFQFEDGFVGLSGPGFLVKRKLEASQAATRIWLSPDARAVVNCSDVTMQREFKTILSRARVPLARRAGRHTQRLIASGSDLIVWKTYRSNPIRMLYWEEGNDLFVAELLHYQAYTAFWKRNPRSRADYDSSVFEEWTEATLPDYADLTEAARAADLSDAEEIEILRQELARAEAERDRARAQSNQVRKEAHAQGAQQGEAAARKARQEERAAIASAKREITAAQFRATQAEARLAALQFGADIPELLRIQQQNINLEAYFMLLQEQLSKAEPNAV